jgi:PadR family transcriptional regulator PadR
MATEQAQLLRGVTDLLVLSALARGRSYGYELAERLRTSGFEDLNEATVYGTLRRLEGQGLLSSTLVSSTDGPARRYYELTTAGATERAASARTWRAFVTMVDPWLVSRSRGSAAS